MKEKAGRQTAMSNVDKVVGRHAGAVAVALVCMLVAANAPSTSALPFTGSPILQYGQHFYMYSVALQGYCVLSYFAGCSQWLECDPAFTTPTVPLQITGGCGPIPSSALVMSRLAAYTTASSSSCAAGFAPCYVTGFNYINCAIDITGGPEFAFANVVTQAGGWLHGGATPIQFLDINAAQQSGTAGWCNAYSRCAFNNATTWGVFNFTPA